MTVKSAYPRGDNEVVNFLTRINSGIWEYTKGKLKGLIKATQGVSLVP